MAERQTVKLTKRIVDAAKPEGKRYRLYDSQLTGFGLRVMPTGTKIFFVQYRPHGGGREIVPVDYTIGKYSDALTPDQARDKAAEILRMVGAGRNPHKDKIVKRDEPTIAELWEVYRAEGCDHKSPSTMATDLSRYRSHILPLLGTQRISSITSTDIKTFLRDVASGVTAVTGRPGARGGKGLKLRAPRASGGKGTATRTVGLLGGLFTFALGHKDLRGFLKENPVAGVERYPDNKMKRFLSPVELERFGAVIRGSSENRKAICIILLLALTGARKGEIEGLRRREFVPHHRHLQLGDSKTGYKFIPLGLAAMEVMASVDVSEESEYVFPATNLPDRHFVGTYAVWRKIRTLADLPDVRLHDLRHTFASVGVIESGNLTLMGRILGHKDVKTTAQYAHLADAPVRSAVEVSALAIHNSMSGIAADLTPAQADQARRMASIDIDVEVIARALGVSVKGVRSAIKG